MNFEFDPFGEARCFGQPRQPHGLIRVHRAARISKQQIFIRIYEIEDVGKWILFTGNIRPPQGHRDHLRCGRRQSLLHQFRRPEFPSPQKETRTKTPLSNF